MFDKLCTRAIVPAALAVTGFVVLCCLLFYSVIRADLTAHEAERSATLASLVLKSTRYAMLRDDRETLAEILQSVGSQAGVEHARIFNKEGRVMFSSDPGELDHAVDKSAEGCAACHAGPVPIAQPDLMQMTRRFVNPRGQEVLAVTAPIYNETTCASGACHEPLAQRKVLGMLDIGLDQAPLRRALATLKTRMTLFSLMVLALTVGGVAALLNRQVFLPIRRLTDFTEKAADGNLTDGIPRGCGDLERLAGNIHRLASGHHRSHGGEGGDAPAKPPVCPPDCPGTLGGHTGSGKDDGAEHASRGTGARRQPGTPRNPGENP